MTNYKDQLESAITSMAQGVSDEQMAIISIAVSLKRIADTVEKCSVQLISGGSAWSVR